MLQDVEVSEAAEELRKQFNGYGKGRYGKRDVPMRVKRLTQSTGSNTLPRAPSQEALPISAPVKLKSDKSIVKGVDFPSYIIYIDFFSIVSKYILPVYGHSYTCPQLTRAVCNLYYGYVADLSKRPREEILRFSVILETLTDPSTRHTMSRRIILTAKEFGFVYNSLVAKIFTIFKQSCRPSLVRLTELGILKRVSYRDLDKKSYSKLITVARTMAKNCRQDAVSILRRLKLYHINPKYQGLVKKLVKSTKQERATLKSWSAARSMPNANATLLANRRRYLERRNTRGL